MVKNDLLVVGENYILNNRKLHLFSITYQSSAYYNVKHIIFKFYYFFNNTIFDIDIESDSRWHYLHEISVILFKKICEIENRVANTICQ